MGEAQLGLALQVTRRLVLSRRKIKLCTDVRGRFRPYLCVEFRSDYRLRPANRSSARSAAYYVPEKNIFRIRNRILAIFMTKIGYETLNSIHFIIIEHFYGH